MAIGFSLGISYNQWHSGEQIVRGRNYVTLLTACIALLSIGYILQLEILQWRELCYAIVSVQMALGPILYFYTRLQTQPDFDMPPKMWLHLLPVPVFAAIWLWQLPLSPADPLFVDWGAKNDPLQGHRFWHKVAAWVSLIGYAWASLQCLRPHEENMKQRYSELTGVSLLWLKAAIWSMMILTFMGILADVTTFLGMQHGLRGGHVQALSPFLTIILALRYGLKQQDIYPKVTLTAPECQPVNSADPEPSSVLETPEAAVVPESKWEAKYQTSSLTRDDAALLWQKLQQMVELEQPHLEPGLKISDLADKLHVSVNHLSESINGYAGSSFYDYINGLRIQEAMRLLADPDSLHLSVTDIGFQAGFNSNSTFFTHFKKITGQTPRQYRIKPSDSIQHA